MCNLYSMTKNVETIRRLFGAMNSQVGNLPSLPGQRERDRPGALGYAVSAIHADAIGQEARDKVGSQGQRVNFA